MDSKIVVAVNMFTINQSVYLPNGEIVHASLKKLPELVSDLCYEKDIYTVEIRGAGTYIPKVIRNIEETELTKYNAHKITFLRNKEFKA